jgi:hypothetical protein
VYKVYKIFKNDDRDSDWLQLTLDTIEGGLPIIAVNADTKRGEKIIEKLRIRVVPSLIKTRDLGEGEEVYQALLGYRNTKEAVEKLLEVE